MDPSRLGERVLVRTMQDPLTINSKEIPVTLGSEIDGAFAEYLVVRSSEAFRIESPLTDSELATFPCAYSTAEGLLQRAGVSAERVLITGASGGGRIRSRPTRSHAGSRRHGGGVPRITTRPFETSGRSGWSHEMPQCSRKLVIRPSTSSSTSSGAIRSPSC